MSYIRIVPRDLFNEAKLLKCLGQFELCVNHTGSNGLKFDIEYDGQPFDIQQNPDDGSIYVDNYNVTYKGERVHLYTTLNSKDNYPMWADYNGDTYMVFDEKGKFYLDWIKNGQVKNGK